MTDAHAAVDVLEPAALIAVELWGEAARPRLEDVLGGRLPAPTRSAALPGGWRVIRVEPAVWWLSGPMADLATELAQIEAALGEDGGAVDISGAFTRLTVNGAAWRPVLMNGAVFDAENPAFGPDCTAGTILHHVAVRHDVTGEDRVIIHVAPSYAEDLLAVLRAAALESEEFLPNSPSSSPPST